MLETIITEAFFPTWVYFHKHSRFTGQREREGEWGYLFNYSWGKVFWTKNLWGVIPNGSTNDQTMPRWRRSFINDKCIFQWRLNLNTVHCGRLSLDHSIKL